MTTVALVLSLFHVAALQQSVGNNVATMLMDHLVGRWTMIGTLGSKQTIHDADARWVLNREYVEFHEVSRDRRADGTPAYAAIPPARNRQ